VISQFQPEYASKEASKIGSKSRTKESSKSCKRAHRLKQKRKCGSKSRKAFYDLSSLERSKENRSLEKSNNSNFINDSLVTSTVTVDSSYSLCKKIKNDIRKIGSNKLSKYMRTCKEKQKGKSKYDSKPARAPLKKSKKVFGHRTGSVDIQKQLKSGSHLKNAMRKNSKASNLSKNSRQFDKMSMNGSLERR